MEVIKNCNIRFAEMASRKKEKDMANELEKFGITDINKIKSELKDIGIKDEQMEGVLGGMIRATSRTKT